MNNRELDFIDLLSIMSFVIGLMNLGENLTQGDKQELQDDLAAKADKLLKEIHGHLEEQDKKINDILETVRLMK